MDIDPVTYNIDVNGIAEAITDKTKAVLPVVVFGNPAGMDRVCDLAEERGIVCIEDSCEGIGSAVNGRKVGTMGEASTFAFYPNKQMTTGEGGCVVTRDDALAEQVRLYRFHGINKNVMDREGRRSGQHYDVSAPGYKYNMMDIQAALGLHQLPALAGFNARRYDLAMAYLERLAGWPQLRLPEAGPADGRHAWHLFAPTLDPARAGMSRDTFIAAMRGEGIGTGLHYTAPHLFSHYREAYGFAPGDFPQAEEIGERIVSLPLFPGMTEADQDRVIATLDRLFRDAADG